MDLQITPALLHCLSPDVLEYVFGRKSQITNLLIAYAGDLVPTNLIRQYLTNDCPMNIYPIIMDAAESNARLSDTYLQNIQRLDWMALNSTGGTLSALHSVVHHGIQADNIEAKILNSFGQKIIFCRLINQDTFRCLFLVHRDNDNDMACARITEDELLNLEIIPANMWPTLIFWNINLSTDLLDPNGS